MVKDLKKRTVPLPSSSEIDSWLKMEFIRGLHNPRRCNK